MPGPPRGHLRAQGQVAFTAAPFTLGKVGVDVGRRGALVALAVDPGRAWQAVALRRRLGRPADHHARHRQAMVGAVQEVGDPFHRMQRGAHVADAQAMALQRQRGGLRQDDGVVARHMPADEVGKAQPCIALRQPLPGAVAVGAEGQHQRRLQHHRLVEVQAAQVLPARRVGGLDHRHHVQVAAGRTALQRFHQHTVDQRRVDGLVLEAADRAVGAQQGRELIGGHRGGSGGWWPA